MPEDRLEQVRVVFLKARELPADQRSAYLEQTCAGDPEFRREVEQLLGADTGETFAVPGAQRPDDQQTTETTEAKPTAPASFPVDSLPAGYRFVRELGRGGQAVVCAAVQLSTGRKVAIKIMRDGPLASSQSRARFDREAQVLAALRHPNIVAVLDRGITPDSSQYIVMDHVPGQTLGEWLRQHGARPTGTEDGGLLRMFMKICSAIKAAHLRGIVHRDIKPSNILVDERGEPFVLDFGLARPLFRTSADGPLTLTGQFLGSLPWSSPEQAESDPDKIDTRTDVYALGVVLYQLLTGGQFPYEVAGTMRDVLNNILTAKPIPPSRIMAARQAKEQQRRRTRRPGPPAVNEVIEAIVLKALSKRRGDRYQTAGELEREIANYLAGLPTIAAGQKVSRRRGYAWMVGGALFAVALAVAGALKWGTGPRLGRRPDDLTVVAAPRTQPYYAKTFTNTIGMEFVRIDPGTFMMGSPPDEKDRKADEAQHKVTLTRPYYIAITPVTQGQWVKVMGRNDSRFGGEQNPVEHVDWLEAVEFCEKLSKTQGKRYRLPAEAEWEYACRAGSTAAYGTSDPEEAGWYRSNSQGRTHPVGQKRPNAWGLYDMHGNVLEWCSDIYAAYLPGDAIDPMGPQGVRYARRVVRGGSWAEPWEQSRSASRGGDPPDHGNDQDGLRVCCEVEPPATRPASDKVPTSASPQEVLLAATKPANRTSFTNTIGMVFVRIDPGAFMMGSPRDEENRKEDEAQHKVTLTRPYYIAITPVTQGQWAKVMGRNNSRFNGEQNPAEGVDWREAVKFCEKMSKAQGRQYRLPTEAEWEYACRAGSTDAYGTSDPEEAGWYRSNSQGRTHPVGQKRPNTWGLYDMHGNVLEWCNDVYAAYPPGDAVDPKGPPGNESPRRVARGGSWYAFWEECRSASRLGDPPDHGLDRHGFRVCCEVEQPAATRPASATAPAAANPKEAALAATEPASDTAFTNAIGMKCVCIEPGEFPMGSPPNVDGRSSNETQHRVMLTKPFTITVTGKTTLPGGGPFVHAFAPPFRGRWDIAVFARGDPCTSITRIARVRSPKNGDVPSPAKRRSGSIQGQKSTPGWEWE